MIKPELQNDSFLRALLRQETDHTPVWLMRQAGRYLPEYRAIRERAGSFLGIAKNPDYATEVTLQPLRRFDLDAAILFSDILTVPDAMGLGLHFTDGEGPRFRRPLRDEAAIGRLRAPDMDALAYVFDTVGQVRAALNGSVPLIGFAGSPWTLACYMVEGGASDDFRTVKKMLYSRPELLHRILAVNAEAVVLYLNAQIEAGAQAVMIFDTWGGLLAHQDFHEVSLAYIRQVLAGVRRHQDGVRIPSIVYTKGGGQWLGAIAGAGADAVGLDWTTDLGRARGAVGRQVALQGNLDPLVLLGGENDIRRAVMDTLQSFGKPEPGFGHVFNLGHGVTQHTTPEAVGMMVDAVHQFSRDIRSGRAGYDI